MKMLVSQNRLVISEMLADGFTLLFSSFDHISSSAHLVLGSLPAAPTGTSD